MTSHAIPATVTHARRTPRAHAFTYPALYFGLDVDELPSAGERLRLFGHNRRAVVSLRDEDYLGGGPGTLRERAEALLARHGVAAPARLHLVTMPRLLGRVFNPVSFFHAFDEHGRQSAVIAEVNNTFGETHLYTLVDRVREDPRFAGIYASPKDFHVSPFYKVEGDYEWRFSDPRTNLDAQIQVSVNGRPEFFARLWGTPLALSDAILARVLARHPLTIALTMPRILIQAARLYYGKKIPVHTKPVPASLDTIRVAPPTPLQRLFTRPVLDTFARVRAGRLTVITPDREAHRFGGHEPGVDATIRVTDHEFFREVALKADIGLGDAYMKNHFRCDDLVALVTLLIANREHLESRALGGRLLSWGMNQLRRRASRNTLAGARRNISAHYDLGNDFYRLFLDPTMMYSCAVFRRGDESLEEAQREKLAEIIAKLDLKPTEHLLEIGTGWGSLAIEAAKSSGCRVTTATLSREQAVLARQRVAEAGLQGRVKVVLKDFRRLKGSYDKIVSIEMIEAIGHENLPVFFSTCDRLLKPGGTLLVQVITVPDQRYRDYLKHGDWIQERVFPGAVCPSLEALTAAATKGSRLMVEDLENIGIHYARTLRLWREAFMARLPEVRALGFDDAFIRLWEYYLCYCEAGFATRTLGDLQLLFTRPCNLALPINRVTHLSHDRAAR